jgi:hypothetical protein
MKTQFLCACVPPFAKFIQVYESGSNDLFILFISTIRKCIPPNHRTKQNKNCSASQNTQMSLFADAAVEAALLADCHRTQFVGKRRCANYPDAEERGKRVIGLAALLGVVAGDAFTQSTQVSKYCS